MRPTDTDANPDESFIRGVQELTNEFDVSTLVLVAHGCIVLRHEMNIVTSLVAKVQRASLLDGSDAMATGFFKLEVEKLKRRHGDMVIELVLDVLFQHSALKNRLEGLMARHTLNAREANYLLRSFQPFEGFVWLPTGARFVLNSEYIRSSEGFGRNF